MSAARVLLVDDDPMILRAYAHVLERAGHPVVPAADGEEALAKVGDGGFDVVVTDIRMPGMGGLELLRALRERDVDAQVVLMTGAPELSTAMRAIEHGAVRYVTKPVAIDDLVDAVRRAAAVHGQVRARRRALELLERDSGPLGDPSSLDARFSAAVDGLWLAFQPIVSWTGRRVHGYEALMRTDAPALTRPDLLLRAAERLGRQRELGRAVRARAAAALADAPDGVPLFVNLHASDLLDEELFDPASPLSRAASRVVLEVTERAPLDGVEDAAARIAALRRLGYRIAVDDLGAGYAGLSTFALLEPDVAKLDMSLVRDVDVTPRKQSIVRSVLALCRELGVATITEGVETTAERATLTGLGCDLLQGYLFARPERGFPAPRW